MHEENDSDMKKGVLITFGVIFAIFLFLLVLANIIG